MDYLIKWETSRLENISPGGKDALPDQIIASWSFQQGGGVRTDMVVKYIHTGSEASSFGSY